MSTTSRNLCLVCSNIFKGQQRLQEPQPHHEGMDGFKAAAKSGCYICRVIVGSAQWNSVELQHPPPQPQWYLTCPRDSPDILRLTIDTMGDEIELFDNLASVSSMSSSKSSDSMDEEVLESPIWAFALSSGRYEPSSYTPSTAGIHDPNLINLARTWLTTCGTEHKFCEPPNPNFRPTRLVQIMDEKLVRVIVTSETPSDPYVAFSHCWGKAKTLKLLHDNIAELRSGIEISKLPESYKEAILVCQKVGLLYIWIDSLCIIQDSADDWYQEASTMKDVYENCTLNICASAAAENSETSFRARDVTMISPLEIFTEWNGLEEQHYYLTPAELYQQEIDESPLRSRAWVLQETYLSSRSLSLTKSQLWWECGQALACETFPAGVPKGLLRKELADRFEERAENRTAASKGGPKDLAVTHRQWIRLVEKYMGCGITVMSDRMMAFSGIAQGFRENQGLADQYIAGVWKSQLPLALSWYTLSWDTPSHLGKSRPNIYRAPSWSWASVEGAAFFTEYIVPTDGDIGQKTPLCSVSNLKLHLFNEKHDVGLLKGGMLELQGHLIGPCDFGRSDTLLYIMKSSGTPLSELQRTVWSYDEQTEDGRDLVTYLDNVDVGLLRQGVVDGAIRKQVNPDELRGQLFCLPVVKTTRGNQEVASGLILIQPLHQPGIFHRIGEFRSMSLQENTLSQFPEKKVLLL